ncbi:DUF4190 domain-containing protein [Actinoplanes sp. NPDC049118]|uniref:DUF4190 domain-containing protein n=1 Tax=Actinoplanes sp. NPDC049118 TaxID=3155769 RepID=UPI0033F3DCD0
MTHHYPPAPSGLHPDGQYAPNPYAAVPQQGAAYAPNPYAAVPQQGSAYAPPPAAFGQSPAGVAHWVLPTGRSWQAVVAGYVALFAVVLWFLGPVALGLGVWALVKASRDRSHGRGRAIFAVVVGVLATGMMLVLAAT